MRHLKSWLLINCFVQHAMKHCVKKSSIASHIGSSKHVEGKKKLKAKEAKQLDVAEALKNMKNLYILRGKHYLMIKGFLE